MNKLKHKLIFVYTTLILILITTLALTSSKVFMDNFNEYVASNREKEAENIVNQVLELFKSGSEPTYEELYAIGVNALDNGLIFMVNTDYENQLICMSDIFPNESNLMLAKMESTLESVYPHLQGEYQEDKFVLEDNGTTYGYVTLGYYGPIYYTEFEAMFLKAVKHSIYATGFAFFIVSGIIVYVLARKISEPISRVSEMATEIGNGNYKANIDFKSSTVEIQNLIDSINSLAHNLEINQQAKKQMSINYTHELRTPLTCVLTTIEGMQDKVFDITDERLDSLHQEVTRITKMINDVDNLIETSSSEIALTKNDFILEELIENTISNFENSYANKNISLNFKKLFNTDSNYLADEEKIKSVVINLISNALKYTNENGEVNVTLDKQDSNYIIKVKDNGIGISKEDKDLIFENLYRADQSRVKEVEGFGVGLTITKNIVVAHNGSIDVNSKIGEGSEFIVKLPLGRVYEK